MCWENNVLHVKLLLGGDLETVAPGLWTPTTDCGMPWTAYRPVHRTPQWTPSMDYPQNEIKNMHKVLTYWFLE